MYSFFERYAASAVWVFRAQNVNDEEFNLILTAETASFRPFLVYQKLGWMNRSLDECRSRDSWAPEHQLRSSEKN